MNLQAHGRGGAVAADRPIRFLAIIALANAGGVMAYLPLTTLLLPLKVEQVAGAEKIGGLTLTIIIGAVAASVANILFGWASDRSVARGGKRRPWVLGGFCGLAATYALLSAAQTFMQLALAIIALQMAINAVLAPLFAIIAEEVPASQKGVAGGFLALAPSLAAGLTALLMIGGINGESARFAIICAASAMLLLPLLLTPQPADVPEVVIESRTPRPQRDFALAWVSRLLVQLAGTTVSLYLLYYFQAFAPGDPALPSRVSMLLLISAVAPLPLALMMGRLSDRLRRRRPFLLASAAGAAAGLAAMAFARSEAGGAIAFGLYAAGAEAYLALHATFAMQLLPDPAHRGRDLGIINLANTLPALAGPGLLWLLSTPRDFGPALLAFAALTLCGGLTIMAVRE